MSSSISLIGSALLAVLVAGYVGQRYLQPKVLRLAGIDLGTTFSSIGVFHPAAGRPEILADANGRKAIPSVVAYLKNGSTLVGYEAVEQSEKNPRGTLYDAKRFIGRRFEAASADFQREIERYSFDIALDSDGYAYFNVPAGDKGEMRKVTPEEVGAVIIRHLRKMAEQAQDLSVRQAVISVPAEFDERRRNATKIAAGLAGVDIWRVISESTAAALAYGLDKKKDVQHVIVVDLGGGTLDVSVLWLQTGVFITKSMAGNNRLGGQDFNQRLLQRLVQVIHDNYGATLTDKEDMQNLRLAVEAAKIRLTFYPVAKIDLTLHTVGHFVYQMKREEFEAMNEDLFAAVLRPVEAALDDADLTRDDIDEIVLVGGSTRIPRVRRVVGEYFGKPPNFGVDPELAVVAGVAMTAGVVGGGWPLQVCAIELATNLRKVHVYHDWAAINQTAV